MTIIPGTAQSIALRDSYGLKEIHRKQAAFKCDQCHRISIGEAVDIAEVYENTIESYLDDDRYGTLKW